MRYLTVALHDATPPYLEDLKEISEWLDQKSIRPRCIKVIPNYLDQWNILNHSEFLDWVLSQEEKGCEIIQHGYTHRTHAEQKGLFNRLRNKHITKNDAEFLKSDYEEARKYIEKGKQILEEAGLKCSGFTSPTWYQSKETTRAIQDCEFRFFTTVSSIYDCRKNKKIFSLAMGYQGVDSFLEYLFMFGYGVMRKTGLFCSPLARMVLHPGYVSINRPLAHALKGIVQLSKKKKLITYQDFLDGKDGGNE